MKDKYDCLYLSLAVSLDARLVTADLLFYEALKDGDYADKLLWVENIPPQPTILTARKN